MEEEPPLLRPHGGSPGGEDPTAVVAEDHLCLCHLEGGRRALSLRVEGVDARTRRVRVVVTVGEDSNFLRTSRCREEGEEDANWHLLTSEVPTFAHHLGGCRHEEVDEDHVEGVGANEALPLVVAARDREVVVAAELLSGCVAVRPGVIDDQNLHSFLPF